MTQTQIDNHNDDSAPKPLRVLIIEDNPDDADFLIRELRRGGYAPQWKRVLTERELREQLATATWDVIVSDHSLPEFSAPEAFAVVREMNVDLPFIIVSGTVGEEIAVAAMRTGVHDFLLKGHLKRLVAAIEREMREAAIRAARISGSRSCSSLNSCASRRPGRCASMHSVSSLRTSCPTASVTRSAASASDAASK